MFEKQKLGTIQTKEVCNELSEVGLECIVRRLELSKHRTQIKTHRVGKNNSEAFCTPSRR